MTKYLHICSAAHSGSTLLDMLAGSHSQVASLGEVNQLSKNIALNSQCGCGAEIGSCELWSEVIRRVGRQMNIDVLTNPYGLHMGYPLASTVIDKAHQTPAYLVKRRLVLGLQFLQFRYGLSWLTPLLRPIIQGVDNSVRVFEAVRGVLAVEAVVDSSKSYLNAIQFYRRYPDRVRIVLLTRDGRGVLWSNMKRGAPRERTVRDWCNRYNRAIPLLQRYVRREHWLQVRYEDLTSDTAKVLQTVCQLIGLPFEVGMLQFRQKKHHIVNGNRIRLSSTSTIATDVEWMKRLPPEDLQFFEQHAGTLNRALGYK